MADKKKQPVFKFGELDKTRRNLGEIDPGEARRISALLGGDVGIEKDSPEITQQYQKISSRSRRKSDFTPNREKESLQMKSAVRDNRSKDIIGTSGNTSPSLIIDSQTRKNPVKREKPNYWVRVRSNFIAARREHSIKTIGSALVSLISSSRRDEINPKFIYRYRADIFQPIKLLKEKSAVLLAGGLRRNKEYRADPFYRAVLEIIAGWDIKTIHKELALLEKSSRSLTIESCSLLCRAMFTPVIRLQNLDQTTLSNSIRHFYELNLKLNKHKDRKYSEGIKKITLEVLKLLPLVIKRIHFGCYPLLMKLSTTTFSLYEDFYGSSRKEYFSFLLLGQELILVPPPEPPPISPEENSDKEPAWQPEEKKELVIPSDFSYGLKFLQEMFPQAGFEDLSQFPDLYPYFQPFFPFPKNFELVPPEDPIQGITIMMLLLKELYFGFGGVKFTSLKTDEWDLPEIREAFEEYTAAWYLILEDFLPKLILNPLQEFSRGIEKGSEFEKSSYGEKIRHKIYWFKRLLYLPHLPVLKSSYQKPPLPGKHSKLYHLTEDLYSLMNTILNSREHDPGVGNIDEPVHFEIPSPVSERFSFVLHKRKMAGTNKDLIKITASFLCIVNELINEKSSFYYKQYPSPIFRTAPEDNYRPLYSVPPLDSMKIIREYDKLRKEISINEKNKEAPESGHSKSEMHCSLEKALKRLKEDQGSTMLLQLRLSGPGAEAPMSAIIENTIRNEVDSWYRTSETEWMVLLTDAPAEGSINLAIRLLKQLQPIYWPEVLVYTGVTSLLPEWNIDQALHISGNTIREAEKRKGEVIVLYDVEGKKYRIYATTKTESIPEDQKDESIS